MPKRNIFLDYGQIAVVREFGPDDPSGSDVRYTARFGADNLVQSYRGFKTEWHGRPTTAPDLVVEDDGSGCSVGYVSWNGATDVAAWAVFGGRSEDQLSRIGLVEYKGFETKFAVSQSCIQVAAEVCGELSVKSNVACTNTSSPQR